MNLWLSDVLSEISGHIYCIQDYLLLICESVAITWLWHNPLHLCVHSCHRHSSPHVPGLLCNGFRVRNSSGKPTAQRGLAADSPTRGTRGTPKLKRWSTLFNPSPCARRGKEFRYQSGGRVRYPTAIPLCFTDRRQRRTWVSGQFHSVGTTVPQRVVRSCLFGMIAFACLDLLVLWC